MYANYCLLISICMYPVAYVWARTDARPWVIQIAIAILSPELTIVNSKKKSVTLFLMVKNCQKK